MRAIAFGLGLFALFSGGLVAGCGGSTSSGTSSGGGSPGSGNTGNSGGSGGSAGSGNTGGGGNTGGTSSFKDCNGPGTCVLMATNCCGYCSYTPLSGYEAIDSAHVTDYKNQVCADPQACPNCVTLEEQNYLALCRAGQCTAIDLRLDGLSACQADTDCRLRWGSGCCEDCGGTSAELVAYNKSQNLEAEVCMSSGPACPPCVPPPYPAGALAICSEGHCKMTVVGP